ncbi:MAG: GNAT family N-acetyltransferase [Trueperaceae bacterium]|nr:GNAT family N-acetyltransferase [Trueperaceae bacterium]
MEPSYGRVRLRPLERLERDDWRRVQTHFRDPEIAHLNGTPPNRLPLWLLRRVLKTEARRRDRATFGIFDEADAYIGTAELYDLRGTTATLGIIIGERSHWNCGYGPEAIHALLGYAFRELGLDRVRLNTFEDNPRAQAAFRKSGFRELRRVPGPQGRTDVQMEIWRDAWWAQFDGTAPAPAPRESREAAEAGATPTETGVDPAALG